MKVYKKQMKEYLNMLLKNNDVQVDFKQTDIKEDKKIITKNDEEIKKDKKFCSNCGQEYSEDYIFCDNCGNKIEDIVQKDKFDNKQRILALVLSILIPGSGHIYMHKIKKGVSYMTIITGLFIFPNIILFNDTNYIIMIGANLMFIIDFIIYIYHIMDVYKTSK